MNTVEQLKCILIAYPCKILLEVKKEMKRKRTCSFTFGVMFFLVLNFPWTIKYCVSLDALLCVLSFQNTLILFFSYRLQSLDVESRRWRRILTKKKKETWFGYGPASIRESEQYAYETLSICRKARRRELLIKSVCTDNSSYTAVRGSDSVGGELRKHTWEVLGGKRRGHLGGLKNNWWVWAYNHHYVLCKCARTAALDRAQDGVGSKKGALKSKWIKIIQAKGSTYSTVSSWTFCWTA